MIPASESDRVLCRLYQEFYSMNRGLYEGNPIEYHSNARRYVEQGFHKYLLKRKEVPLTIEYNGVQH